MSNMQWVRSLRFIVGKTPIFFLVTLITAIAVIGNIKPIIANATSADLYGHSTAVGTPASTVSVAGMAVASDGMMYISDQQNGRVIKYNPSGSYVSEFISNDQLYWPTSIAIDELDNLYILDLGVIKKFDSDGIYIGQFGGSGTGNGEFMFAQDIAIAPSGEIYVVEFGNFRVQSFSTSGVYISQFSLGEQQESAAGIAIDSLGRIYITHADTGRVEIFDEDGNNISSLNVAPGQGASSGAPFDIAINSDNVIYITQFDGSGAVQRYDPSGNYVSEFIPPGGYPLYLAVDPSGDFYVFNDEVQKFDTSGNLQSSYEATVPLANNALNSPKSSAVDESGNLYVADTGNSRVLKFDTSGEFVSILGSNGSANGQFNAPTGITIDSSGNIYVLDAGNNRVQKFNNQGIFDIKWGTAGSGTGQFNFAGEPAQIALDGSNNVYVVDSGNNRVQKFSSTGTYVSHIGNGGSGNGQFSLPTGIDIDADGNIYVVDTQHHRVEKFDANGNYLLQFGSLGTSNGQLEFPVGVTIDSKGNVFVADQNHHRIQIFKNNGEYLYKFGTEGSDSEMFKWPFGITIDSSDNLYVADMGNSRIQVFSPAAAVDTILPNAVDGKDIIIGSPLGTVLSCSNASDTTELPTDPGKNYPLGFVDFCLDVLPGSTHEITLTFATDLPANQVTPRKYSTTDQTYSPIEGSTVTESTRNNERVLILKYLVQDGGALDDDGQVNGTIVDPVGLSVVQSNTPAGSETDDNNTPSNSKNSSLSETGMNITIIVLISISIYILATATIRYSKQNTDL